MTTQHPVRAPGAAPRWVRGLMHLGLALAGAPIGLLGYHALGSNADAPLQVPGESTLEQAVSALGLGGGYANRRLYAPDAAPGLTIDGLEDQSAYANLFYSYNISRTAVFDANLLGSWYASGLPGSPDVYGVGANASLSKNFGRLGTMASLGVFGFDDGTQDEIVSAQALLGARYTF